MIILEWIIAFLLTLLLLECMNIATRHNAIRTQWLITVGIIVLLTVAIKSFL